MQTKVAVLEARGHAALVEWNDANGVHRAYIPPSELSDRDGETDSAFADSEVLAQGIAYGAPWELLPIGSLGAEVLAQALRGRGIWNYDDAKTRVNELRAAIQDAYARDLRTILEASRAPDGRTNG